MLPQPATAIVEDSEPSYEMTEEQLLSLLQKMKSTPLRTLGKPDDIPGLLDNGPPMKRAELIKSLPENDGNALGMYTRHSALQAQLPPGCPEMQVQDFLTHPDLADLPCPVIVHTGHADSYVFFSNTALETMQQEKLKILCDKEALKRDAASVGISPNELEEIRSLSQNYHPSPLNYLLPSDLPLEIEQRVRKMLSDPQIINLVKKWENALFEQIELMLNWPGQQVKATIGNHLKEVRITVTRGPLQSLTDDIKDQIRKGRVNVVFSESESAKKQFKLTIKNTTLDIRVEYKAPEIHKKFLKALNGSEAFLCLSDRKVTFRCAQAMPPNLTTLEKSLLMSLLSEATSLEKKEVVTSQIDIKLEHQKLSSPSLTAVRSPLNRNMIDVDAALGTLLERKGSNLPLIQGKEAAEARHNLTRKFKAVVTDVVSERENKREPVTIYLDGVSLTINAIGPHQKKINLQEWNILLHTLQAAFSAADPQFAQLNKATIQISVKATPLKENTAFAISNILALTS